MEEQEDDTQKRKNIILVLLFIVVFILGFVLGCYVCSFGDSGTLTVEVVDGDGDLAPNGTEVEVESDDGQTFSGTVDDNGAVTFTGVEDNEYDIKVSGNEEVSNFNYDGTDQTKTVTTSDNYGPSKPDESS